MTQSEFNFIQEALSEKVEALLNNIVSNENAVRDFVKASKSESVQITDEDKPSKPKASSKKPQQN